MGSKASKPMTVNGIEYKTRAEYNKMIERIDRQRKRFLRKVELFDQKIFEYFKNSLSILTSLSEYKELSEEDQEIARWSVNLLYEDDMHVFVANLPNYQSSFDDKLSWDFVPVSQFFKPEELGVNVRAWDDKKFEASLRKMDNWNLVVLKKIKLKRPY